MKTREIIIKVEIMDKVDIPETFFEGILSPIAKKIGAKKGVIKIIALEEDGEGYLVKQYKRWENGLITK